MLQDGTLQTVGDIIAICAVIVDVMALLYVIIKDNKNNRP